MTTLSQADIEARTIVDNTYEDPTHRAPLVLEGRDFNGVTEVVSDIALAPLRETPKSWMVAFMVAVALLSMLGLLIAYLLLTGVGVWGE